MTTIRQFWADILLFDQRKSFLNINFKWSNCLIAEWGKRNIKKKDRQKLTVLLSLITIL
jgi:hypothetical protein